MRIQRLGKQLLIPLLVVEIAVMGIGLSSLAQSKKKLEPPPPCEPGQKPPGCRPKPKKPELHPSPVYLPPPSCEPGQTPPGCRPKPK